RVPPQGPDQRVRTGAALDQAAPALVGQREHAVDVAEGVQRGSPELLGDHLGGGRRAVHGRQYGDVVTGTHPAVRAVVALEGPVGPGRQRHPGGTELLRPGGVVHREVVYVHVVTGRDVHRGHPDRLAVLVYRRPSRYRPDGQLVPA